MEFFRNSSSARKNMPRDRQLWQKQESAWLKLKTPQRNWPRRNHGLMRLIGSIFLIASQSFASGLMRTLKSRVQLRSLKTPYSRQATLNREWLGWTPFSQGSTPCKSPRRRRKERRSDLRTSRSITSLLMERMAKISTGKTSWRLITVVMTIMKMRAPQTMKSKETTAKSRSLQKRTCDILN